MSGTVKEREKNTDDCWTQLFISGYNFGPSRVAVTGEGRECTKKHNNNKKGAKRKVFLLSGWGRRQRPRNRVCEEMNKKKLKRNSRKSISLIRKTLNNFNCVKKFLFFSREHLSPQFDRVEVKFPARETKTKSGRENCFVSQGGKEMRACYLKLANRQKAFEFTYNFMQFQKTKNGEKRMKWRRWNGWEREREREEESFVGLFLCIFIINSNVYS